MEMAKISRRRSKSLQSSSDNEETAQTPAESTQIVEKLEEVNAEKESNNNTDKKDESGEGKVASASSTSYANEGVVEMETNPTTTSTNDKNDKKAETELETVVKSTSKDSTSIADESSETAASNKRKFSEIAEDEPTETPPETDSIPKTEETTKSNESALTGDSLSNIDLPPKQSLGKGKRARIPNKRYSDILLSPTTTTTTTRNSQKTVTSTTVENGGEEDLSTVNDTNTRTNASPPTKKQKLTIDIKDPIYMKPFQLGWKRELVYRGTNDTSIVSVTGKRQGDIYYYTPSGKKVRSMREISENLTKDLTLENFTFVKEPLGLNDPAKEIIRDAKYRAPPVTSSSSRIMRGSSANKSIGTKTATSKILTMSSSSPQSVESKSNENNKALNSSSKTSTSRSGGRSSLGNIKVKLGNKSRTDKKNSNNKNLEEIETIPQSTTKRQSQSNRGKTGGKQQAQNLETNEMDVSGKTTTTTCPRQQQPTCSIRCQRVLGLIPTLQCRLCLCLYHYECVGIMTPKTFLDGYICKNCQFDHGQIKGSKSGGSGGGVGTLLSNLPPLTPINSLKSMQTSSSGGGGGILPKLRRLSQDLINSSTTTPPTMTPSNNNSIPQLVPLPATLQNNNNCNRNRLIHENNNNNKSLVGSVTSWLPHNSTIQVNNNNNNLHYLQQQQRGVGGDYNELPRPQYIEYLGGRKFLIIPKHNVVSVTNNGGINNDEDNNNSKDLLSNNNDLTTSMINVDDNNSNNNVDDNKESKEVEEEIVTKSQESVEINNLSESNNNNNNNEQDEKKMITETNDNESENNNDNDDNVEKENDERVQETNTRTSKRNRSTNNNNNNNLLTTTTTINNLVKDENKFMNNFLQNVSYGYSSLLYIFQYLKVQDLLRAGCVCTMWRDIVNHPTLWKTVRMKNSQVHSFDGLANSLKKYGTIHLDLRKMLLPNSGSDDNIWLEFSKSIEKVQTLRKIELCRCPANVIEQLAKTNQNLNVINAVTIKSEKMNLDLLNTLHNLIELRLKSTNGLILTSDINALKNLKNLKILSLTSIRELNLMNLNIISELINLESLDLGECVDFPKCFGQEILIKLTKLEKLRLEKGQGDCHTFEILESIKLMPKLEQLELVNFDIKIGFDEALGNCGNIKKLLLIPTYISQSATTNHMVLGGVIRLKLTLSHFVWGVTLELLRVTELFVDQCNDENNTTSNNKTKDTLNNTLQNRKDKKSNNNSTSSGDSIPVLKPVPIVINKNNDVPPPPANDPPEVEILPLPNLQKLLLDCLPTTRVKILKIPFHATWRQSITDNTN